MPEPIDHILKLEVPIIVQLAEKNITMGDVLAMVPGMIIEFPKAADEELELMVNNKAIGTGTAVKVGENFGIRLSFIGDVRSRIEALGGSLPRTSMQEVDQPEGDLDALAEQLLAGQG